MERADTVHKHTRRTQSKAMSGRAGTPFSAVSQMSLREGALEPEDGEKPSV